MERDEKGRFIKGFNASPITLCPSCHRKVEAKIMCKLKLIARAGG